MKCVGNSIEVYQPLSFLFLPKLAASIFLLSLPTLLDNSNAAFVAFTSIYH